MVLQTLALHVLLLLLMFKAQVITMVVAMIHIQLFSSTPYWEPQHQYYITMFKSSMALSGSCGSGPYRDPLGRLGPGGQVSQPCASRVRFPKVEASMSR